MRLSINLATRPYEDARQFWLRWGGAVALLGILTLVLLFATVNAWISARKDRLLIADYQQQIAARDQDRLRAEAVLNRPENRAVRDRSQFLNDLFERKAFSWTRVFEDLERVMPPGLHVVSIRPAAASGNQLELKLIVAGESRDRAIELVRKMETSQHFQQTQIDSEEAKQDSKNPQDDVQFAISALYDSGVSAASPAGGTH
jgi:type IV pilus assembly protein PilN